MGLFDLLTWRNLVGGVAPSGAASASGDISQMVKGQALWTFGGTQHSATASSTGDLEQKINQLLAGGAMVVRPVYSTYSPESIGQELSAVVTVASLTTDGTLTQNLAYFIPLYLPASFTVRRFLWRNGSVVAGNVTAALFSLAGVLQGTRTASTAMSGGSSLQAAAPSGGDFTVVAGQYLLAFTTDSATAQFIVVVATAGFLRMMGVQEQAADYALASPATLVAHSTDARVPWIAISSLTTN
jgi:hypothetical protein